MYRARHSRAGSEKKKGRGGEAAASPDTSERSNLSWCIMCIHTYIHTHVYAHCVRQGGGVAGHEHTPSTHPHTPIHIH